MSWALHHADCLGVDGLSSLPDRSVDHVITDPPYEEEAHSKQRRQKTTRAGAYERIADLAPLDFEPMTEADRIAVCVEFGRITRGWVVVFCQVEAVHLWRDSLGAAGLRYRRTIPWCKPDAMPALHGRWPGQSFESIVLAQQVRAAACPGGGKSLYFQHTRAKPGAPGGPNGEKAVHPTTKPLSLMLDLVDLVSSSGDVICDPFAGSGTTGVAARMRGRNFVGWERKREYFDVALRKIDGQELRPRSSQSSLFGGAA